MKGITIHELYDFLLHNHEIEFSYNNALFSMEPYSDDKNSYFAIWNCSDVGELIAISVRSHCDNNLAIDRLLNIQCFDGKSFREIEKDVTVTVIY